VVRNQWVRLGVAIAVAVLVTAFAIASVRQLGIFDLLPGSVAVLAVLIALVGWPWRWWPLVAGIVSVAATVAYVPAAAGADPGWVLLEPVALLVLVFVGVRWGSSRITLGGAAVAGLAVALLVRRYLPDVSLFENLAACAFWGMGAVVAAAVAAYLRWMATQRERALVDARRGQRLKLAHDLHDFVAHDVSEMVAQAQAARWLSTSADGRLVEALERIEQAGLRALGSIDQTVHALQWESDLRPVPGLAELPELAERFSAARVRVDIADDVAVPRDVGSTVYRVVTEALTNVRRHAPTATEVLVKLARDGPVVRLTVSDNGGAAALAPAEVERRGGLGLPGLAERVEVLGGSLTAGPYEGGWRLAVHLPVVP
jgi:signal transduction histidine kinase